MGSPGLGAHCLRPDRTLPRESRAAAHWVRPLTTHWSTQTEVWREALLRRLEGPLFFCSKTRSERGTPHADFNGFQTQSTSLKDRTGQMLCLFFLTSFRRDKTFNINLNPCPLFARILRLVDLSGGGLNALCRLFTRGVEEGSGIEQGVGTFPAFQHVRLPMLVFNFPKCLCVFSVRENTYS